MSLRETLDRTLLLMRDEIDSSVSDGSMIAALTGTRVALVCDADNLVSHSAQSALATAALLIARSGHAVHLLAPDVTMVGVQTPLGAGSLVTELMKAGGDILPGVEFNEAGEDCRFDLVVAFGDTPVSLQAARVIRINATEWSGVITQANNRWGADEWPMGGLAAAALVAGEAFKCAIHKLGSTLRNPERLSTVFAFADEITVRLAPENAPKVSSLGAFDCVSGGAIIHAVLYVLARLPGVTGYSRVVEPDTADPSNLNRYAILLRSTSTEKKATQLAAALTNTGLIVEPLDFRFDTSVRRNLRLAPAVLVGVDDIPTRWEVQRANPEWLAIGATSHWCAMSSFHTDGLGCAECAHPYDDPGAGRIPTIAFVSFWAGLLTATYFVRHVGGSSARAREQQIFLPTFRADNAVRSIVPARECCPSCSGSGEQAVETSKRGAA